MVNATYLSMVVKENSLAFDSFPTFVIPASNMDAITKTMSGFTLRQS